MITQTTLLIACTACIILAFYGGRLYEQQSVTKRLNKLEDEFNDIKKEEARNKPKKAA